MHLNALIKVGGVVTRRTSVFPQIKTMRHKCMQCQYVTDPVHVQGDGKIYGPDTCPNYEGPAPVVDYQKTLYRNYQRLTLQSPGQSRLVACRDIRMLSLVGDLIDKARPGENRSYWNLHEHL